MKHSQRCVPRQLRPERSGLAPAEPVPVPPMGPRGGGETQVFLADASAPLTLLTPLQQTAVASAIHLLTNQDTQQTAPAVN